MDRWRRRSEDSTYYYPLLRSVFSRSLAWMSTTAPRASTARRHSLDTQVPTGAEWCRRPFSDLMVSRSRHRRVRL
eukprot:scaffold38270_cov61-Phaeocystis_antarctica.AAC.7